MEFYPTRIAAVVRIVPRALRDERGTFMELFNQRTLEAGLGLQIPFVQDNQSYSTYAGTVRALHFQAPPMAQGKLVRVVKGAIRDVAVDVRRSSATYGQHVTVDLDADMDEMLWVPPGFAHGYVTRAPETEVTFKTTAYFSPTDEVGVIWNDPDLAIDWGISAAQAVMSDKDQALPPFAALSSPF